MNFLDDLTLPHRQALIDASTLIEVAGGTHLVRRGEPGGDLFLLLDGQLQVVDTRTRPATIIANMRAGDTIGEIAFIDHAPRSADVRAAVDSTVRHWTRVDLDELMNVSAALGADFYEALCRIAARRLRNLTQHAITGAIGSRPASLAPGARSAVQDAATAAVLAKNGLRDAEVALRADPTDADAADALNAALDTLQHTADSLLASHTDKAGHDAIAKVWRDELHPWVIRSALAERCLRRPRGITGTPEILSHVLVGTPTGDGQIGELIDRWFLERPTHNALRAMRAVLVQTVSEVLPRRRGRRVLLLNAGTGSVANALHQLLSDMPSVLTIADPSRDALAFMDTDETKSVVSLTVVREDLAAVAESGLRNPLPPQDVIVVHDLLPYLPDRLAVSLLRTLAANLAPNGVLIASSLAPSEDVAILDLLLRWPTIRRSSEQVLGLAEGTGLTLAVTHGPRAPWTVVRATQGAENPLSEATAPAVVAPSGGAH